MFFFPISESNCIKKDQPDEPKEDELEETEDIVDELNEAELKLTKEYVYPPIHLLKAPVAISNHPFPKQQSIYFLRPETHCYLQFRA